MDEEPKKEKTPRRAQVEDADYVLSADEPNVPRVRETPSGGLASAATVILGCVLLLFLMAAVSSGGGQNSVPAETRHMTFAASERPGRLAEEDNALGLELEEISAPVAAYYRHKGQALYPGVGVYAVAPDGPCDGRLQPGDVITAVNGEQIRTCDELTDAADHGEGILTLIVLRAGDSIEIELAPRDGTEPQNLK